MTTAPAPTVANRPTTVPATTTAPAPIEQPRRSRIGLTVQSSARASSPARVIARGKRSFVRIGVRADEDAVLHRDAVVDQRRVLDLDAVADRDALVDERVAPHDALRADARPGANLGTVPDAGPGADGDAGLEVRGRVDAGGGIDHVRVSVGEGRGRVRKR